MSREPGPQHIFPGLKRLPSTSGHGPSRQPDLALSWVQVDLHVDVVSLSPGKEAADIALEME